MKNKERLLEEYIEYLYREEKDGELYAPEVHQSKLDFKAGFEAGTPKWIDAVSKKPNEDERVLCRTVARDIPEILSYEVCRYYQENWYGDLNDGDMIIQWMEIPQ